MTPLAAGTRAPAFSLLASSRDGGEGQVSLTEKDFRGRPLILAFYPADWSPVCGDQLALYNAVLPQFERLGATLLGISVDGVFCHQAYARDRNLRFPLASDFEPKGSMARNYGVYRTVDGTSERALFVIDGDGVIRWSYVSPVNVNPGADGILRALEALRAEIAQADGAAGFDAPRSAPVDLVEFGDYECPYCRKAHPIVKQLKEQFGDRLHFRFRNFPLSQIHPHAKHAAEAAVSVRSQAGEEAFWAMHDTIFAHQRDGIDALDDAHLARYAENVGADGARVRYDLDTGKFEETVEVDFVEGVRMGVNGTPTFFINGERFDGDWRDVAQFSAAIEEAAARSEMVAVR
ncbi:MAG TPA: redoxin domain-containing protein [Gemmatimonadaceae bacterium]|jgi:peroxiredoxin/protein-disulfide isomerase|nr:redoxin domain-containing protein [Gemmatimonadaceae bacterium]